jgi:hypothetical protein
MRRDARPRAVRRPRLACVSRPRNALPGSEDIALEGGATGIWAPGAGQVAFVLKGGTVVAIQVLAARDGDFKAAAASLAGSLANHLP